MALFRAGTSRPRGRSWRARRRARSTTAAAHYFLARIAREENDVDAALDLVGKALAREPTYADAWAERGLLHFRQRDFAAAEQDLRRCLELDPDNLLGEPAPPRPLPADEGPAPGGAGPAGQGAGSGTRAEDGGVPSRDRGAAELTSARFVRASSRWNSTSVPRPGGRWPKTASSPTSPRRSRARSRLSRRRPPPAPATCARCSGPPSTTASRATSTRSRSRSGCPTTTSASSSPSPTWTSWWTRARPPTATPGTARPRSMPARSCSRCCRSACPPTSRR